MRTARLLVNGFTWAVYDSGPSCQGPDDPLQVITQAKPSVRQPHRKPAQPRPKAATAPAAAASAPATATKCKLRALT